MAWAYRLGTWRKAVNLVVRGLLRLSMSPPHTYLMTVRGRKTGRSYSTPVILVEREQKRWLVAPYGEVGWVRNARGHWRGLDLIGRLWRDSPRQGDGAVKRGLPALLHE